MKTIKTKEWKEKKNNWQIKWAQMTAPMQDYKNPKLPRYIKRGEGGETKSHTNQKQNPLLPTK